MAHSALTKLAGFACSWLLLAGCGASEQFAQSDVGAEAPAPAAGAVTAAGEAAAESETSADASVQPRIIYTARVALVADDFSRAAKELVALVEEVEGYIASANLDRPSGRSRSGSWTVRVPSSKFEQFLGALDAIAFVESRDQRSEDVTLEYVDVEARIKNLQRLEERFVTLLAEKTGKLEDILKVEQELARVRGDVEQAQGRLRYLTNKTDFSTVTVTVREQKDYIPPKAPEFGDRIATTWWQSLGTLKRTGETFVLFVVAVFPWLAVTAVPACLFALAIRSATRRKVTRSGKSTPISSGDPNR